MSIQRALKVTLAVSIASLILTDCASLTSEGPCMFTANIPVTAYRLPDSTSGIFSTVSTGDTYEALARTADGWIGFDPGVPQAPNVGLARHRWVLLNVTTSPSCLSIIDPVTLADVEADVTASGQ